MYMPELFTAAMNFITMSMWAVFLSSVLERRFSVGSTVLLWLGAYVLWALTAMLFPYTSLMRTVGGNLIVFAAPFAIYKGKWFRILFKTGLTQVAMLISDLICFFVFTNLRPALGNPLGVEAIPLIERVGTYLLYLPLQALLLFLAARVFSGYLNRLNNRDWLLFTLFPVSQVVLISSWYLAVGNGLTLGVMLLLLGALALSLTADIAMYFAMRGMTQRAMLLAEKAQTEKLLKVQHEHYAALAAQYESIRRMRHDIDNHLHTIHILLNEGQLAEAKAYSAELQERSRLKSDLGSCQNPILDAYLFHRVEELKERGIEVREKIVLPEAMKIANVDLISAFGNLLDNAAEACAGAREKWINVSAGVINDYLVIEIENPLPENRTAEKGRRIPELERGLGSSILNEKAEKYNGKYSTEAASDTFRAVLMLQDISGIPA